VKLTDCGHFVGVAIEGED